LTRPTAAFITFEEEDARIIALSLSEDSEKLLDGPMKLKAASEPTDIIWENRIYTESDYLWRQAKAYSILTVLMACSFALIYLIARTSANIAKQFPPVDCQSIEDTYGDLL